MVIFPQSAFRVIDEGERGVFARFEESAGRKRRGSKECRRARNFTNCSITIRQSERLERISASDKSVPAQKLVLEWSEK